MKSNIILFVTSSFFINLGIFELVYGIKNYNYNNYHRLHLEQTQTTEEPGIYNIEAEYNADTDFKPIPQKSIEPYESGIVDRNLGEATYIAKKTFVESTAQDPSKSLQDLADKEIILHNLEQQRDEASKNFENTLQLWQFSRKVSLIAKQISQQAQNQASSLAAILNNAQNFIEFIENFIKETSTQLVQHTEGYNNAKKHLENIEIEFKRAQNDFDITKETAERSIQQANKVQNSANTDVQYIPKFEFYNGDESIQINDKNTDYVKEKKIFLKYEPMDEFSEHTINQHTTYVF